MDDVLVWLAATNHYLYADVFRDNDITGEKLRQISDIFLSQLNITDSTHKQSLLLAIQELFTGQSETVSISLTLSPLRVTNVKFLLIVTLLNQK